MRKKIYILSRYNVEEFSMQDRVCYLSCMTKLDYVMNVIKSCGYDIEILSSSNSSKNAFCPSQKIQIDKNTILHLSPGFKLKGGLGYRISNYLYLVFLFFNLLFKIPYRGTLLVYHSCFHMEVAYLIKKIKRVKLIIEAEEIFGDVVDNENLTKKELSFFKNADAYIFPTKMLDDKVNVLNKPTAIAHGTYKVEEKIAEKFNDGKIHIVYAGTFDEKKGGCAAVESAGYLDSRYHIHICGFGTKEQIDGVMKKVEEVNNLGKALISFEGLLKGEAYLTLLQKCHLGLSTQDPSAKFNDTSFPSKILSYMANGLRVVSVDIPAIKTSDIGIYMHYYEMQNGEEIAKVIKSVDFSVPYTGKAVLRDLDSIFKNKLNKVLESLYVK